MLVSGVSRTGAGPGEHEPEQDWKPGHNNMEDAQTHTSTHPWDTTRGTELLFTHLESTGTVPKNNT